MSFQYSSNYKINEDNNQTIGLTDNNMTVRVQNGNVNVGVQVFPNDINNESLNNETHYTKIEGFKFIENRVDNTTNISYAVYKASGSESSTIVYLFKVGNKTVKILGGDNKAELDVMNKILQTIN